MEKTIDADIFTRRFSCLICLHNVINKRMRTLISKQPFTNNCLKWFFVFALIHLQSEYFIWFLLVVFLSMIEWNQF